MDWEKAKQYLKDVTEMYKTLPYQSAWFVVDQLAWLTTRLESGERTEQLYKKIMAME